VTDLTPPRIGGISKVATELAYGLCDLGHDVEVFCLNRSVASHSDAPFLIHVVQPKFQIYKDYPVVAFSLAAFKAVLKRHQERAFDVSHAMNFNNYGMPFLYRKMRKAGLRHVSTAFETTQMEISAKWKEFKHRPGAHLLAQILMEVYLAPWQRFYIGWADAITTEDQETRSQLQTMGIDPAQVSLVPSGIDVNKVNQTRSIRPKAYAIGKKILLCPGRVDPRKGTQYLIRALLALSHQCDEMESWQIVIAGGGRGQYLSAMERLVEELGLSRSICFTGRVDDLHPFYQHADAVVIPSLSEGIPITLQEALVFECPVFCSKLEGTYHWAKDQASIRWFLPGDVSSMVECLSSVARLPSRETILEAKAWVSQFSWENVVKRYADVYAKAISGDQKE
jgi:glycosyltransferase involved in cell wall biosynthesis